MQAPAILTAPGFSHRLHLDYETASEADLRKTGAYKYARDKTTRPLMLGWAIDDEPGQLWQPHLEPLPSDLKYALTDGDVGKHAFNAQFERLITRHCLEIEVPIEQWRCTMVESYYLGFAGGLDQILKAIGLPTKDKRGGQLINLFSTPAPKNHKADWYDWSNRPREWEEFCEYCRQDVRVERALWRWLRKFPGMNPWDWQQWFLDQRINDRGVPMDIDMAHKAIEIWDIEKQTLHDDLAQMTGMAKVTREPFLRWIEDNFNVKLESTRKDYLAALLMKGELPEEVRPYVDMWAQKEGKAVSKYQAVLNGTCDDGRARGMFQYKGASRTDRAGGRLIQLQNLKRPFAEPTSIAINNVVDAIKTGSPDLLRLLYPLSVSEILGGAIRHVIKARQGHKLAICDLSSIESVVLGWIAQCPAIDQTFRAGRDSYKVFATKYFGIEYEEVTKGQRSFSKPPVLGCGFMLGWKGLIAYAEGYGVDMQEDEAKRAVDTFRGMYPEIPAFWKWIYDAVKYVVATGQAISGYRLHLERDQDFLRIWLPSGRALSYYKPEVRKRAAPWSEKTMTPKANGATYEQFREEGWTDEAMMVHGYMTESTMLDNFSYMGMNDKTQWVRIFAHAGGVTENIVQSIAGDLLWNGLTNADAAGLQIILHVHDEIGAEVPTWCAETDLSTLQQCMVKQPEWAKDMWLGAAGFTIDRYTKD